MNYKLANHLRKISPSAKRIGAGLLTLNIPPVYLIRQVNE